MWRIILTILVLLVAAGEVRAMPETITYEIITDESLLSVMTRYTREYIFWGQFQLTVDYDLGTAAFQNVNVTIEEEIRYIHFREQIPLPGQDYPSTDDLGELFLLTELESTSVTSTGIDFLLEKNIPSFPGADIYLELTFDEDLVHITGYFGEPVADGHWYNLDATATVVPEPAVLYVDADAQGATTGMSWTDAFTNLQEALSVAAALPQFNEIRVAQGEYRPAGPGGDREATFQLINDVIIRGGYAGFGTSNPNARDVKIYKTILTGDLNSDDRDISDPCDLPNDPNRIENSYNVVTGSGTNRTAVLDGFIITAGNDDRTDEPFPGFIVAIGRGGGMFNDSGSPKLNNCTFISNSAGDGGGMYCGQSSSPEIINSTFIHNHAERGGGIHCRRSSPTLTNCKFIQNTSSYGGGGGMNNRVGSNVKLYNCIFRGNIANRFDGGGMRNSDSDATLKNCMFIGNSAEGDGGGRGGGMSNNGEYQELILVNCTFSNNSARYGGGIKCWGSSPILTNCILWGDKPTEIFSQGSCMAVITYSDVQGGWPGLGNIDEDPCFVNPDANDYHLLPDSPCIDTGVNNSVSLYMSDLDGEPRIFDGDNDGEPIVDMGVYEYVPKVECEMRLTPRSLNLKSKGKWVKAHIVLPGGYSVADVDVNRPCEMVEPFEPDVGAEYVNVFINEDGLVEVEAWFARSVLCSAGSFDGTIKVAGRLTNGWRFVGTDTIRVIDRSFEGLSVLSEYWLVDDCEAPDWCGGLDLDQDGGVNFIDFVLLKGCCIEAE